MAKGEAISCKTPQWVVDAVQGLGETADTSMDDLQEVWRSWWSCDNEFYRSGYDLGGTVAAEERLSLRPAQMVAEEWPALIMTEGTRLGAEDEGLSAWIDGRLPSFCERQADFVAAAFALGAGVWCVSADISADGAATSVEGHRAWECVPLLSGGMAVTARVAVDGRTLDQLQVHRADPGTGTWHVVTRLFEPETHREVASDSVIGDLDTLQALPTFAVVSPALPNTYFAHSPLGVSCFAAAIDACRMADEAYNQLYWQTRLSLPRVFLGDSAIERDPRTGKALSTSSLDQVIYRKVASVDGVPVTVYNPDTHIDDMVSALNCALATLGIKAGFGQQYWSFDLASGLKTATEVVASNATLMRSVRRHENAIEGAMAAVVSAAYATEEALSGRPLADVPRPGVTWDDSVVTDSETERAQMKDDIARGLCPAWMYPVRYWGMDEAEARAFTGDAAAVDALGEE